MAFDDYGGDCGDVGGDVSADTGGDYASDTGFDDAGYDDSASDFDDTAEIEEDGGDLTDSAEEDISDTDDFAEDTADSDDFSEEDSADTDDFAEDTADSDDFSEEDSADTDDFAEDTADSDDFSEEDSADTDDFAEDTADSDDFSEPETSETEETGDEIEPEASETEETGDEIEPETAETEETGDEIEPEASETEETGDEMEPEASETEETVDEMEPEAAETEETADEMEPEAAETEETVDEMEPETAETEETGDEIEPEATETEETADTADDSRNLEYRAPDNDPEPRDIWADDLNEANIPKDTAPEAKDYIPDYDAIPAQDAAHGFVKDSAFAEETGDGTVDPERLQSFTADTKLEDMTRAEFDALTKADAACAHQILTDYNDRTTEPVDVTRCPRDMQMADGSIYYVTDQELSPDHCTLRNAATAQVFQCYPSAQLTAELIEEGQQGQNSIGMQNDCGLASTAYGVNILNGKFVTSEQRETQTAKATGNCNLNAEDMGGGIKDYSNCGGTNLECICRQYENNGLDARGYEGDQIPTMDEIGEQIKNGGTVSLAVNHSLLWYDDLAPALADGYPDDAVLSEDQIQEMRDMRMIENGRGVLGADHAINLSNAVYNEQGELTHFIVNDTGTGKRKMLSRDYLQRALTGNGGIRVENGGCVFVNRRQS